MIKIYSKTNCPRCEQVKEYVKGANIEHEVIDVTNNMEMLAFLRGVAQGAGFPVVQFDDGTFLAGQTEPIIAKLSESIKEPVKYDWSN